jgi:hypothetical protein
MMKLRSVTAGVLATAMLATSVTPAMAQGYPGGYPGGYGGYGRPSYGGYGHPDHRRHRGDDTGAIVAGVIGVGILAAIIASASSSNNRSTNGGYARNNYTGAIRTDDAAADACANAAEQQVGGGARVSSVDAVDRVSDGFNVRGVIDYSRGGDTRYGTNRDQRSFSCSVRYGDVQRVDLGGFAANY